MKKMLSSCVHEIQLTWKARYLINNWTQYDTRSWLFIKYEPDCCVSVNRVYITGPCIILVNKHLLKWTARYIYNSSLFTLSQTADITRSTDYIDIFNFISY